jgi:TolA-binding protein
MKIVAAGFITALLVFVVASAMSEMKILWTPDATHSSDTTTRRKTSSAKTASESVRSPRGPSRTQRADTATQDSAEQQTAELQRKLSEIRQRESEVQAKQDALRIVFEEIHEQQQSVDFLRRRVSEEIAALRDAAVQVAQREAIISTDVPSTASLPRSVDSPASARPIVSLRDSQAVRDTAVLVNRLAQQGSIRAATALLRSLKDRDAAKVLSELSATDSQMALRLSQDLLAARDEAANRR